MTAEIRLKECGTCGEPLLIVVHEETGRPAPLEERLDSTGKCLIDFQRGTYRVVPNREIHDSRPLRLNHYARCPHASAWRERRTS